MAVQRKPAHKSHQKADPLHKGHSLIAAGRISEALTAFEAALEADPNSTPALSGLGTAAQRLGMIEAAKDFFSKAIMLDPDQIEARGGLASAYRADDQHDHAIETLKEGIERNPSAAPLWLALGNTVREQGDLEKAETFYREAANIKPNYGAALGNLADLLYDKGECDDAMALYDRAVQGAPKNAQLRVNRAVAALADGDSSKGWREYEWRFRAMESPLRYHHGLRPWDGKEMADRTLLIAAEQGVGDQILFASAIAAAGALSKSKLIIECEERLVPLFQRSFPDAQVHAQNLIEQDGSRHAKYHWLKDAGGADRAVHLGSLPKILRMNADWAPEKTNYLCADKKETQLWSQWLQVLGTAPKYGLCWRSGKTTGVRAVQYAPLEAWAAFAKQLPGDLICTQYDASEAEVSDLSKLIGRPVHMPPKLDQKQDIDRACALLSALDQVISAPTAVASQAAALGTPTLKILNTKGWTAMGRADYEPMQPACKLVNGDGSGDWKATFEAAKAALADQ